jgi:NADH-quinone oxidoreductase subunit H
MEAIKVLFFVLVFPGFLFQFLFAATLEWVDRKLYARMQNRVGPLYTGQSGFLQPIADLVKLFAKEDLTPAAADKFMFNILPLISLAAVCASGLLVPLWVIWHPTDIPGHLAAFTSFPGDIIVDAYLLAIPSFALFLAGWFSSSPFSLIGASRVLTQMFAYEVPFFLALLTPAVIAGSWQIVNIMAFPWWEGGVLQVALRAIGQTVAFGVAVTCLQAKLERVPFDIPEAETEVVAGPLTEYSGKKYGIFRLQKNILMYTGAALVAAVFMPSFPLDKWMNPGIAAVIAGIWLLIKTIFVVSILSLIRASFGRIRIDQIVVFSWKYLAPLSLVQFLVVLILKAAQGGVVTP